VAVLEVKRPLRNRFGSERLKICPFGCNGYVTAVAAGQSQRFYSGVGIFNWRYLSSPPQIPRVSRYHLETRGLILWVRKSYINTVQHIHTHIHNIHISTDIYIYIYGVVCCASASKALLYSSTTVVLLPYRVILH
jgi:hypothetical protein